MSTFLSGSTEPTFTLPVYEGYAAEYDGGAAIIMESFDDQLAVVAAINEAEVEVVRLKAGVTESSIELVLEAAGGGVVDSIMASLKKLGGKIMAFLDSIIRYFDGLTKSAAAFADKYADKLRTLDLEGYKREMFDYTIPTDVDAAIAKAEQNRGAHEGAVKAGVAAVEGKDADAAKEALKELKEGKEKTIDKIRGTMLGAGELSGDEFKKALHKKFRGGSDEKKEVSIDIFKIMDTVKESPKLKEAIKKAKEKINKIFNEELKKLDTARKAFRSAKAKDDTVTSGDHSVKADAVSALNGILQTQHSILQATQAANIAYINAWLNAVKERDSAYKSALVSAFSYKAGK